MRWPGGWDSVRSSRDAARRLGLHPSRCGRSLRSTLMSEPQSWSPPEHLPRWVWKAVAIFWLGYILAIVTRSVWSQSLGALHPVAGVTVPVAGDRAGRQPAGRARVAPRHGDGRDPASVSSSAFLVFVIAIGTLVGQQIATLLGDSEKYVNRTVELPQRQLRHPHQRHAGDRRRSTILTARCSASSAASRARWSTCRSTALGVLVQGACRCCCSPSTSWPTGPKLRRRICSRLRPDRQRRVLSGWELAIDKTGGYLYSRALLAGLSAFFHWVLFQAIGIQAPGGDGPVGRHHQPVPAGRRHVHRRCPSRAGAVRRFAAEGADHLDLRDPLPAGRELLPAAAHHRPHDGPAPGRRVRMRPSLAAQYSVPSARSWPFRQRRWRRRVISNFGERHEVIDSHLTSIGSGRHDLVAQIADGSRPGSVPMATPEAFAPVAITRRSGLRRVGALRRGRRSLVERTTSSSPSAIRAHAIYPRSSNKPMQAVAMVRAGLRLPPDLLALVCASHDGTPMHIEAARRILATAGLDERSLANTADLPLDRAAAEAVLRAGGGPTPSADELQRQAQRHAGDQCDQRLADRLPVPVARPSVAAAHHRDDRRARRRAARVTSASTAAARRRT